MSFFGKFKTGSTSAGQSVGLSNTKKDQNAPQPTLLEQRLADVAGPVRADGSDKFFGLENYGSTCYCNSIIQCLYYSAPFRENVLNFPIHSFLDGPLAKQPNGNALPPQPFSTTPYPNLASPARKPAMPSSPGGVARPEDSKDSPEYRKRQALTVGPVLDVTQDNSSKYGTNESLFTSLRDIFEAIIGNQSRTGVVSPHRFLEILRRENEMFRSAMHQDAHEFLNLLLNQVMDSMDMLSKQHPDASSLPAANGMIPEKMDAIDMSVTENGLHLPAKGIDTRWVHDLFEGQLTSETRCLTCENTSQRDEAFLDISVDLESHTSVTSCLRKFSEEEMLCERNKFHCDNCGGLQEAEKRMKIKRLPRILALHLKRFKYTEDLQRLQKLFHRVVYPFHLRLFNTTDDAEHPDRIYELYAVVVHIGGGPYHGHYVSIIKTQDRGWLLFDDEMVEPVDKSYVLNFFGGEPSSPVQDAKQLACAYVLFYQETTLESVLREQEAEGQPAPTRLSNAEMAKDNLPSQPFRHHNIVTNPTPEDATDFANLAHSVTAPQVSVPSNPKLPNITHSTTAIPLPNTSAIKSRKELKREERDRKAASKAKQPSVITTDSPPPSSISTSTSLEHPHAIPPQLTSAPPVTKDKESGLSRFRSGAKSIRESNLRLFSSSKMNINAHSNENGNVHGNGHGHGMTSSGTAAVENGGEAVVTALPPRRIATTNGAEGKKIGMKFGLRRKKSAAMS